MKSETIVACDMRTNNPHSNGWSNYLEDMQQQFPFNKRNRKVNEISQLSFSWWKTLLLYWWINVEFSSSSTHQTCIGVWDVSGKLWWLELLQVELICENKFHWNSLSPKLYSAIIDHVSQSQKLAPCPASLFTIQRWDKFAGMPF